MKNKSIRSFLGWFVICASVTLFLFAFIFFPWLIRFVVQYASPDQQIETATKIHLAIYYFLGASSIFVCGSYLLGWIPEKLAATIKDIVTIEKSEAPKLNPAFTIPFLIGSVILLLYVVVHEILDPRFITPIGRFLYEEDYFFEYLTTIVLVVSAVLIGISIMPLYRQLNINNKQKYPLFLLALIAFSFFFIGMEEISWGQRIIGWDTPELVAEYNYQDETNLHNLINLWSGPIYMSLIWIVFVIMLVSIWMKFQDSKSVISKFVLPDPSLIGLTIVILISGINILGELTEELIALFAWFYSLRIYKVVSRNSLSLE